MKMNKNNFGQFREDVKKALRDIESKYGVDISCGNISYSANQFTLKLEVVNKGYDPEKEDFMKYCEMIGMKKDDYERTFIDGNTIYKIIGMKFGNKYDIICQKVSDSKKVLYRHSAVKELLC